MSKYWAGMVLCIRENSRAGKSATIEKTLIASSAEKVKV